MWTIQLAIAINFISSKDVEEERVMYSKSDNIEFIPYSNANQAVDELFEPLLSRNQIYLETSVILFSIQFNCCITYVTRSILNVMDHILILQA